MPRDTLRGRNKYTSIKLSGDGSLGSNLDTIYVDETASILKLSKNKLKISGDIEIVNSDSLTVKDGYLISKKSISFQNNKLYVNLNSRNIFIFITELFSWLS